MPWKSIKMYKNNLLCILYNITLYIVHCTKEGMKWPAYKSGGAYYCIERYWMENMCAVKVLELNRFYIFIYTFYVQNR